MGAIFEQFGSNLMDPATKTGAVFVAFVVFFVAKLICMATTKLITRTEWVMGQLHRKVDKGASRYVVRIKNLIIYFLAAVTYVSLVPSLRALMATLVAGAGIAALVIGFAAKSSLANLIAGLSLAIYRPFRIGDVISIESEYGTIEDMTLRHTILKTWENKRLIIPNERLDNMSIVNWSLVDTKVMVRVEFGISYDTDIDLAKQVLLDEAGKCPHRDLDNDPPWVRVIAHNDFSIVLRAYLWASTIDDYWQARFWLFENVKKRFDRENIEIPFPYRTLVYKKDLPHARLGAQEVP
jgi:small-conductance mechanosensitive channel